MKSKFLLFLPVFLLIILGSAPVLAQEEATESSQSVEPETVKESVKKRLEDSLNDKLDKVKGVLQGPGKLYGFFGQVETIKLDSFTLKRTDQQRTVLLGKDTSLLFTPASGSRKTIEADEITQGWYVLAMGEADNQGQLQAQRIIFYEESPVPAKTRQVVFGKVAEIESQKLVLKNHDEKTFTITKSTQLTISGVTDPEMAYVTVDDKAVAIYEEDEEELTLKALFVWPGTANPEAADNQVNAEESTASAETEEAAEK